MELFLIIWSIFGLLAYGQFIMNLGVSVQFQKEVSKKMETYTGYNIGESILFTILFLFLLIASLLGGILGFILSLQISKQVINERLRIEKLNRKFFDRPWCT